MRCEIVMVRHAASVPPAPGGPDELHRPLTAAGLATAEAMAQDLAALRPTAIVSSPYLRAVQTVAPAADLLGREVRCSWDLREWDSGIPPCQDYARHYEASWAAPSMARPGAESLNQLTTRALDAISVVAEQHPGGVVLVGSHGTFISRLLAGLGHDVDWAFCRDMPMPAVYRLRWPARAAGL